eukprot:comp17334_c0_seq1/m.16547 comp17334_c0_seq1/g.16547  ORF comp17334_c0_seq1/g.16547 comp17334_c0_seq1/m.16547 type:complete len:303 (-) comp17334_c0_seq1:44-952(-)
MFSEANERVANAERARHAAQQAQAEAEKKRAETEKIMTVERDNIAKLKAQIHTRTVNQPAEEPKKEKPMTWDTFKSRFTKIASPEPPRQELSLPSGPSMTPMSPTADRPPYIPKSTLPELASTVAVDKDTIAVRPYTDIDPVLWEEFKTFSSHMDSVHSLMQTAYYARCLREDIEPCLAKLPGFDDHGRLLDLMATNDLLMEPRPASEAHSEGMCKGLREQAVCTHRMKSVRPGDSTAWVDWQILSPVAYQRLQAVAQFIAYLRYAAMGLVSTVDEDVYAALTQRRIKMAAVRLGWTGPLVP